MLEVIENRIKELANNLQQIQLNIQKWSSELQMFNQQALVLQGALSEMNHLKQNHLSKDENNEQVNSEVQE